MKSLQKGHLTKVQSCSYCKKGAITHTSLHQIGPNLALNWCWLYELPEHLLEFRQVALRTEWQELKVRSAIAHPKKGSSCPFPELHIWGHPMISIHKCNTFALNLMSLGSRVRVGGRICAISLPGRWYGCRNTKFVRISPTILFPYSFMVKSYLSEQEKGGLKICP